MISNDLMHFHPRPDLTAPVLHYYSVLGRALNVAQHLEIGCRALMSMFYLKTHPEELFEPKTSAADPRDPGEPRDGIRDLKTSKGILTKMEQIAKKTLGQQVKALGDKEIVSPNLSRLLGEATEARNALIHSIVTEVEDREDLDFKKMVDEIVVIVRNLAAADKWIAALLTMLNKDPLPGGRFFDTYEDRLAEWVTAPTFRS